MGTTDETVETLPPEKAREYAWKREAEARASADPLPGPLGDAFAADAIMVGNIGVRKIVASDWQFFKKINSPVLRVVQEILQNPNSELNLEVDPAEYWAVVWQFTHTPKQCRDAFAKGEDDFRALVAEEVGDSQDEAIVNLIIAAVMEQIKRSWSTALQYKSGMEKDEGINFPQAGASKMASAGG